jgi:hypothetical protein
MTASTRKSVKNCENNSNEASVFTRFRDFLDFSKILLASEELTFWHGVIR